MYARRQEKHARRVGTPARKHARHIGTWGRKRAKDVGTRARKHVGTWAQKARNLADSKIKNINNGKIDFCNS